MPAGTETFLIYNVTLDFTDKPTNLKFYQDIEKQQEVLLENNKYIAFNGFITWDSNDNKIRQQTYYWDWPYETGEVDENGIAEGDAEDSKFAGKTMSMNITATGTQVLANTLEGKVATTLINGELGVHDTVQDAVNTADNHSGAIITLLEDRSENISIAHGQNIVLDLNGKNLSSEYSTIDNYGELTIKGTGIIYGGTSADGHNYSPVVNAETGILTFMNGTIRTESSCGIVTYGTANIMGGIITAASHAINTYGTTNIMAGTITSNNKAGVNIAGGTVTITGAPLITGGTYGVTLEVTQSEATINTTGGKIKANGGYLDSGKYLARGVQVCSGGTLTIGDNSNALDTSIPCIEGEEYGAYVRNGGTLIFYDGVIKGKTDVIVGNVIIPNGYHRIVNADTDSEGYRITYLESD